MSDAEWKLFEDIFPKKARKGRGMPAAYPRNVLNSLLFILITGCRWCDLPQGPCWASKSSAHRWLKSWYSDGRPRKNVRRLAVDKGYDADALRNFLKKKGIQPQIPRKRNAGKRRGRPVGMTAPRFQVERTFSWLQRKFRRLAVRWERLQDCFDSFLSLALCFMWVQRLVG